MKSVRWIIAVIFLASISSYAQCDWFKKLAMAIQRRYGTNEAACKALVLPPQDFNNAYASVETDILREYPMISAPDVTDWLTEPSDQMLALMSANVTNQQIHITDIAVPNAFATGQHITFHTGLVDWYLNPEASLTRVGLTRAQARDYLESLSVGSPGENGLIGVLAHETAHNILGHPNVRPFVLACEDYISTGSREVKEYEQLVSTGKTGSRFGGFFKAAGFIGLDVLLSSQREQEMESDADELGAWLAYRITNDPETMARSLQWLSAFPGFGESNGWSEILCSDHPQLLSRVERMQVVALSVKSGPPRELLNLPQSETKRRYKEFVQWYPARVETIRRIASGDLTLEERQKTRTVQIELKPSSATGWLDGETIAPGKQKLTLGLGPHVLAGEYKGLRRESKFVVLDEGPDKFNLDVK